jgi:hypothetical protein
MRILSLIVIVAVFVFSKQKTESPHGKDFKISCTTCHSTKGWELDKEIYSFDHKKTSMPLTGQHSKVDCRQCHKTLVFNEAKNQCFQCHTDIHQATTGQDCAKCHTTTSWLVNNVEDIHRSGRFPLFGAHRLTDCLLCHKSESSLRFDVPGVLCIDCHRKDFISTTAPNHITEGFSQDCMMCHSVSSLQWKGSSFTHVFFPLNNGHSAAKCTDCHTSGKYSGLSAECVSCHLKDYNSTTNPVHKTANFSTVCTECHSTVTGWSPTTFDHNKFPLTLGHSSLKCNDCHKDGKFTSVSTDCYNCHLANYNSTINPNHKTLAFSTVCTQCHTTNPDWKPASYAQHDSQYFPIYSGKHRGQWKLCTDCHNNPVNYTIFNCKSCHSNAHRGKNYTDSQCYSCHPRGSGG